MKKQSKRFLQRSCSLLLAFVLCVQYFPLPAKADSKTAGRKTGLDDAGNILSLENQEPEELSEYPEDVYGKEKNQPFLLSEQNELGLIVTNATDNHTEVDIFDTFDFEMVERDNNGNCRIKGITPGYAETMNKLSKNPYTDVYDVQSIGFDAEGVGRKRYIASVGFNGNKAVTLVLQNAVTGAFEKIQIGANNSASEAWNMSEFVIDNVLAITAGDYDGDGKDSVIVYVCQNGNNVRLMEYQLESNGSWNGSEILNFSSVLVETRYKNKSDVKYKPCVSLATGDFNGDGRDQLAYSAGFYNTSDNAEEGYVSYSCSDLRQFATCVGIGDRGSAGWSFEEPLWMYQLESDYTMSGSQRTYPLTIMHGGMITAGDVNNDGIDEIVAAGYVSRPKDETSSYYGRATYTNGQLTSVDYVCNFSADKLVSAVIGRSADGYQMSPLTVFSMSTAQAHTQDNYCNNVDYIFTKLPLACAKTNGNNTAEDVFIAGIIYDFSDSLPSVKHQTSFLNDELSMIIGTGAQPLNSTSSVNFVRRVAVGNFNGNDAGREQFVFTFWQKLKGKSTYTSVIGVISGVEYSDVKDSEGNVVSYGVPEFYGSSLNLGKGFLALMQKSIYDEEGVSSYRILIHSGCSSSNPINATPVAVDVDNDGIVGRFSKSGYVYTDPEVLAVLEAGPYFGEIGEAGGYEGVCETRYAVATGFGTGTSRADNVSFEVGFAEEMAVGPVKASLEAGYTMDWSHSYETTYTVTTSMVFAAQSEDVVVISRVPVLIYTYDILKDGLWIENGMNIRVPLSPRYFMLSIDDYNEFVDEYNDMLGSGNPFRLIRIQKGVDLPLDHEGNPDKYWSSWSSAGEGAKQLSKKNTSYSLGYASGYIACEYEVSVTETEAEEVSHGFHFGLTLQLGGDGGPIGEAWAGGYVNLDYSHSSGHSTTSVDTTASGGQVQNIKASAVNGLTTRQVQDGYGFQWNFGKWTRKLMEFGSRVPFYGYTVSSVVRRALPPAIADWTESVDEGYAAFSFPNLTSGLSDDLTVTKVSGNGKITYNSSTGSIDVAAGLTAGSYPAVFKISNGLASRDTTFKFTLKVTGKSGKWMKNANGWWYQRPDGTYPKNQWEKIDGKWYHFDEKGYMQTGWLKLSGKWYYLGTNGVMVTGWKQVSGKWYCFNDSGVMITGWKQISGKWYYFNTGGDMVTGWKTISSKTYFFKSSGEMAAGEWCGGYYLNANGTWTYRYKATWRQNAKGWWFGDESGWYAKNCTITIDGRSYTFNAGGYWVQ